MTKTALALICLAVSLTAVHGYIVSPIVGYQQGIKLAIYPSASTNDQCTVYGAPTPYGYAPSAPTPLYLYTPKNTGAHTLEFTYDSATYTLNPFLAPGDTTLQIDDTNEQNPIISFDATSSPQGQSGYVTVSLTDSTGATVCYSQFEFYVDEPLSCLPTYGGIYTPGVTPSDPPPQIGGGGNYGVIVIPGNVQIYAPTYIQQTVINQFVTVNNIQINNVVNNVNVIQNNTIIIEPTVPPTPPPVNCTETPEAQECRVTPGQAPPAVPTGAPPRGGPPAGAPPPTVTTPTTPTTAPTTAISTPAATPPTGLPPLGATPPISTGRRLNF